MNTQKEYPAINNLASEYKATPESFIDWFEFITTNNPDHSAFVAEYQNHLQEANDFGFQGLAGFISWLIGTFESALKEDSNDYELDLYDKAIVITTLLYKHLKQTIKHFFWVIDKDVVDPKQTIQLLTGTMQYFQKERKDLYLLLGDEDPYDAIEKYEQIAIIYKAFAEIQRNLDKTLTPATIALSFALFIKPSFCDFIKVISCNTDEDFQEWERLKYSDHVSEKIDQLGF